MAYDEALADHVRKLLGREERVTEKAMLGELAFMLDMTGRPMNGWILVAPDGLETERELADRVRRGVAFVRTLPPKD